MEVNGCNCTILLCWKHELLSGKKKVRVKRVGWITHTRIDVVLQLSMLDFVCLTSLFVLTNYSSNMVLLLLSLTRCLFENRLMVVLQLIKYLTPYKWAYTFKCDKTESCDFTGEIICSCVLLKRQDSDSTLNSVKVVIASIWGKKAPSSRRWTLKSLTFVEIPKKKKSQCGIIYTTSARWPT